MIKVRIVAQSQNTVTRNVVTTVEATYPRIIHEEVLTHRTHSHDPQAEEELSRNSASSRAIPTPKWLATVSSDPFVPEWLMGLPGMANSAPASPEIAEEADRVWLHFRDAAVEASRRLNELGLLKHHANRPIYALQHITTVMTATEGGWRNFFGLRFNEGAAPEFIELAGQIFEQYHREQALLLEPGQWHLPYITYEERRSMDVMEAVLRSATRCGRVSYLRQGEVSDYDTEVERARSFIESRHWSTCEHPSKAMSSPRRYGNITGFKSLRKHFKGEGEAPLKIPESWKSRLAI